MIGIVRSQIRFLTEKHGKPPVSLALLPNVYDALWKACAPLVTVGGPISETPDPEGFSFSGVDVFPDWNGYSPIAGA